jgi:hypothetical protein
MVSFVKDILAMSTGMSHFKRQSARPTSFEARDVRDKIALQ